MKIISSFGLLVVLLGGCASTVSPSPAPQHAMASCEELTSGNGGPTDPNPNEVRHSDCR